MWWVYVIQSNDRRFASMGRNGPYYVGCTTCPSRRIRQHCGEIKGGGKYTSKYRPWVARALYGPYANQSEAMKAERALKRGKRGTNRTKWTPADSKWCRGAGALHPWVQNPKMTNAEIIVFDTVHKANANKASLAY